MINLAVLIMITNQDRKVLHVDNPLQTGGAARGRTMFPASPKLRSSVVLTIKCCTKARRHEGTKARKIIFRVFFISLHPEKNNVCKKSETLQLLHMLITVKRR